MCVPGQEDKGSKAPLPPPSQHSTLLLRYCLWPCHIPSMWVLIKEPTDPSALVSPAGSSHSTWNQGNTILRRRTLIFSGHDLTQPASLVFLLRIITSKWLMMPEATSLASCGEMRNSVHVWVCRRVCSTLQREVVSHTVHSWVFVQRSCLSGGKVLQNATISPAGREGFAPLTEGKWNPLLRKVPEQESCWVSGSLILSFLWDLRTMRMVSLKAGGITEGLQRESVKPRVRPCWEEAMVLDLWGTDPQGASGSSSPFPRSRFSWLWACLHWESRRGNTGQVCRSHTGYFCESYLEKSMDYPCLEMLSVKIEYYGGSL